MASAGASFGSEAVQTLPIDASNGTEDIALTQLAVRSHSSPPASAATQDYPGRLVFFTIYGGLLLTTFVVGFDSSCIGTITPVLTDEFHSLDDVGWYGIAYLIPSAATIISYGKIYKHFPAKRVYLLALGVYLVGSIICATAQSSLAFIVGRALAGLGSAGLIAGSNILLTRLLPLHQRPLYQGYIGGMESVAIAIGPLVGGAVTLASSWRVVFYISIPMSVINGCGMLLFSRMPDNTSTSSAENIPTRRKLREIDIPGFALFFPCIVCLVLALSWGGVTYRWSNFRVILTLTMSGVLALGFGYWQHYRKDSASLPPRILKQRSILFSCIFSFCNSGSLFVLSYYLPIYFQAIKAANTLTSGVMILPLVGGLIIAGIGAGHLTTWIGYFTPSMIASTIFMSVAIGLISTFQPYSSVAIWVPFQLLAGLGCGLGFQQPYIAVQTVADKPDVPVGLVTVGFAQRLGNIVALAMAQNIFNSQLSAELKSRVPQVLSHTIEEAGATSIVTSVPARYLPAVLEAYSTALDRVFYIAVAFACLGALGAFGTEFKTVKKDKTTRGTEAEQSQSGSI
ncbi:hypothetical protein MBLNU459_g5847t1 [Dothideomycetes sp. NU459]